MLKPAVLRMPDMVRLSVAGLRARPLRAILSALGIAIGIAAMVAVVGISESSRAQLQQSLDALGTNLLTAQGTSGFGGGNGGLPERADAQAARIDGVTASAATADLDGHVYRNDLIPAQITGGIVPKAAYGSLPDVVGARVAIGQWFNEANSRYPVTVLGADSAVRLGIDQLRPDTRVLIDGVWHTVIGVLEPSLLAPELDSAALVPGAQVVPEKVYVRVDPAVVEQTRELIAPTLNPRDPSAVNVSRPSDALAAKNASEQAFSGLLLGLGAIGLLVGGIGVANTMIITVLERRGEIGVRRSLGATRRHITTQFLGESLFLAALGGVSGVLIGSAVTAVYASMRDWIVAIPAWAAVGGVAATVVIGAIAGLYPALRAARVPPTAALSTL